MAVRRPCREGLEGGAIEVKAVEHDESTARGWLRELHGVVMSKVSAAAPGRCLRAGDGVLAGRASFGGVSG